MNKFTIGLLFLILSYSCTLNPSGQNKETIEKLNATDSENEQKIRTTINTYFEGWMTGDTSKLGRAMHRTCQLKNIKDDDVIIFDRATYLGFFKPRTLITST